MGYSQSLASEALTSRTNATTTTARMNSLVKLMVLAKRQRFGISCAQDGSKKYGNATVSPEDSRQAS